MTLLLIRDIVYSMVKLYTYKGQSKPLSEWAVEYGIGQKCLASRIRLQGLSIDEALNKPVERRAMDIAGHSFGRWSVISRAENNEQGRTQWNCKCECGTERIVVGTSLTHGLSKSCGCLELEQKTIHGLNDTYIQTAWENIKGRCYNANYPGYKNYGGRGIYVCDEWLESIEQFYKDMGDRPTEDHSIDRIDNDGPYSPENCRWATQSEQTRNSRQSKRWYVYGVKYDTALEAAKAHNVEKSTIRSWCNGRTENGKYYPPKENCYSELYYKEGL